MLNTMSKTENALFTPAVALSTVWDVDADQTYKIKRKPIKTNALLAIRTAAGQGVLEIRNCGKFTLPENSLILVKLSDIRYYATKNNRWKFKWMEFYGAEESCPALNKVFMVPNTELEIHSIRNFFCLLSAQNPDDCLAASALFSSVLLLWRSNIGAAQNTPHQNRIEQAVEYINLNINSPLLISELAAKYNICERAFRDAFKQYQGVTPKQYIEQRKLDLAMEYLKSSYMQVKEISQLFGFSNPYYFSRAFKKYFGQPPSVYINKMMIK